MHIEVLSCGWNLHMARQIHDQGVEQFGLIVERPQDASASCGKLATVGCGGKPLAQWELGVVHLRARESWVTGRRVQSGAEISGYAIREFCLSKCARYVCEY